MGPGALEFPTESLAFAQCARPCLRNVFRGSSVQLDDLCQPFCVPLLQASGQATAFTSSFVPKLRKATEK